MRVLIVIVATSPAVDTSLVVGPFRTYRAAVDACTKVETQGYITEICEVQPVDSLTESPPWDDEGDSPS